MQENVFAIVAVNSLDRVTEYEIEWRLYFFFSEYKLIPQRQKFNPWGPHAVHIMPCCHMLLLAHIRLQSILFCVYVYAKALLLVSESICYFTIALLTSQVTLHAWVIIIFTAKICSELESTYCGFVERNKIWHGYRKSPNTSQP